MLPINEGYFEEVVLHLMTEMKCFDICYENHSGHKDWINFKYSGELFMDEKLYAFNFK